MNRHNLTRIARGVEISLAAIKRRQSNLRKESTMFNNQYLFQHIDRQPNVIITVHEQTDPSDKPTVQAFNKQSTLDVYVVHGVTFLELKLYANSEAPEPTRVLTFINPRRWGLIGQADPEEVR